MLSTSPARFDYNKCESPDADMYIREPEHYDFKLSNVESQSNTMPYIAGFLTSMQDEYQSYSSSYNDNQYQEYNEDMLTHAKTSYHPFTHEKLDNDHNLPAPNTHHDKIEKQPPTMLNNCITVVRQKVDIEFIRNCISTTK
ncbi:hypothetical protein [Candidatus Neoehrlichia procyonis]|uniref:Uncharacterized protein n=1 Tax=Candidatus Neoehrlichia procyonis str. RAC413 TaxID=1359163 RepID=A0A0F3NN61_9RICK|nr:hypothetical protein [Candidatus Neoehrlichia lotoris]KJV69196.1 hypothetical protein NLO413_0573 [Candidatus Neoehrlichia lotoris str. RAC413]